MLKKFSIFILFLFLLFSINAASTDFISVWNVSIDEGVSGFNNLTLPLQSDGNYNFTVDWGDGTSSFVDSWDSINKTHNYLSGGEYILNISGKIDGFGFNLRRDEWWGDDDSKDDGDKLINIYRWGNLKLSDGGFQFYDCENLINFSLIDSPNLTNITSFNNMFYHAVQFNSNLNFWNVSNITDMSGMFYKAYNFNQPLDSWNVSSVTNMRYMFQGASSFNQALDNWDTSSVTDMSGMFQGASNFNGDISSWDVSSVGNMDYMFYGANSFNGNLTNWCVIFILEDPSSFSYNSLLDTNGEKPIWGTCPNNNFNPHDFISIWKPYSSRITLPLESTGSYDFIVNWGDGSQDSITTWDQAEVSHTYSKSKIYKISISGKIQGFRFANGGDKNIIYNIFQWGDLNLGNDGAYFYGCRNLDVTATDSPDLNGTTNFHSFFRNTDLTTPDFNNWNVSHITNMFGMFSEISNFKSFIPKISSWDTSSVTDMGGMFALSSKFNTNISSWDVSSVTNMDYMFANVINFTYDISSWNTSYVTDMKQMFDGALYFNQDLSNWDVSSVTDMAGMFHNTYNFNQDISSWDTSSVINMSFMFSANTIYNPLGFNQPLSSWNTSSVTDMSYMFYGARNFNQDLSNWDVSSVTNMDYMFYSAKNFNQDLSSWNISNILSMDNIFSYCPLYPVYYSNLLVSWSLLTNLPSNVELVNFNFDYYDYANESRQYLIDTYNWNINDGNIIEKPAIYTNSFITLWNTSHIGVSNDTTIELPLENTNGYYNFTVDWGDGNYEIITNLNQIKVSHDYHIAGIYKVNITGLFRGFRFNNMGDKEKIINVLNWGNVNLGNSYNYRIDGEYFYGCSNLDVSAMDSPDLSKTTSFNNFFANSGLKNPNFNSWDTSSVTDMSSMFSGASSFNGNISNWDTSSVIYMYNIFDDATSFNGNLGHWDTSSVTRMSGMFSGASSFNSDLSSWDVSSVEKMSSMFSDAISFNQPLNKWNISSVNEIQNILKNTNLSAKFYSDILVSWANLSYLRSNIYLGSVNSSYFEYANPSRNYLITNKDWDILDAGMINFNEDSSFISVWNTSLTGSDNKTIVLPLESTGNYNFNIDWGDGTQETITSYLNNNHTYSSSGVYTIKINGAINGFRFNNAGDKEKIIDISQWGDLNLGNNGGYFYGCSNLNSSATDSPDLNGTTNFYNFFKDNDIFNGDLSSWNVSSVTDMHYMFSRASSFNQPLDNWNTSSVNNMQYMFYGASSFNQPLSSWNVSKVSNFVNIFTNSNLSTNYYSDILISWSQLPTLEYNLTLDAPNINYYDNANSSRQYLIDTYNWTINDGNLIEKPAINISIITPLNNSIIFTKNRATNLLVNFSIPISKLIYTLNNLTYDITEKIVNLTLNHSMLINYGINNLTLEFTDFFNQTITSNIIFNVTLNLSSNINDSDNDGINNSIDNLFGNTSNIYSNLNNLTLKINNSYNLSKSFNNSYNLTFYNNNSKIIEFENNFSDNYLNLANVIIQEKLTENNSKFFISGLDLINESKTIYFNLLGNNSKFNSICIKDSEIIDFSEMTNTCDGINETYIHTIPSINGNYVINYTNSSNSTVKIQGLSHSGISQICTENWRAPVWSGVCTSGIESEITTDNNNCGTTFEKPVLETRTCDVTPDESSGSNTDSTSNSNNDKKKIEINKSGTDYISNKTSQIFERNLNFGKNILENFDVKIGYDYYKDSIKYSGVKKIVLRNKKYSNDFVEFELNLSDSKLNLSELSVEFNIDYNNFSYVLVKNLNLFGNTKKIKFKQNSNSNLLCIKDEDLSKISEISNSCNGTNEYILTCNGIVNSNGYSCLINNGYYEVSGLKHSGVIEYNSNKNIDIITTTTNNNNNNLISTNNSNKTNKSLSLNNIDDNTDLENSSNIFIWIFSLLFLIIIIVLVFLYSQGYFKKYLKHKETKIESINHEISNLKSVGQINREKQVKSSDVFKQNIQDKNKQIINSNYSNQINNNNNSNNYESYFNEYKIISSNILKIEKEESILLNKLKSGIESSISFGFSLVDIYIFLENNNISEEYIENLIDLDKKVKNFESFAQSYDLVSKEKFNKDILNESWLYDFYISKDQDSDIILKILLKFTSLIKNKKYSRKEFLSYLERIFNHGYKKYKTQKIDFSKIKIDNSIFNKLEILESKISSNLSSLNKLIIDLKNNNFIDEKRKSDLFLLMKVLQDKLNKLN